MRLRTVGLAVIAALVVAACGGTRNVSEEPRQAVSDAFERMSDWRGAELVFHLDTDVASLVAADDTGELTEEQAQAIIDGRLVLKSYTGEDLADTSDDELEMLAETGDTVAMHVMTVGADTMFVRSEVRELIERFGDEQALSDLEQAAGDASEFGIDFAEDFFDGSWLELTGMKELTKMYSGMAGIETPEPSELESLREDMNQLIQQFLEEITVEYVGSEDPGEHVRLVATAQEAGQFGIELFERFLTLMPAQPGLTSEDMVAEMQSELEDAPDVEIPLELWLDGGVISRIGFDLMEFARRNPDLQADMEIPPGVDRLVIVADVAQFGGGLDMPDDAIEVDLFELIGKFMGPSFQAESATSGSSETITLTEMATEVATVEVEATP